MGVSLSSTGYGVYGRANATSGCNYGVYGGSLSDVGYGVYGEASKYGVCGYATGTSGVTYGVRGIADAPTGWAVYGEAQATTGPSVGVNGYSKSPAGCGVKGWASSVTGETYGVYGEASSPDGYGGYFVGRASTDILEIRGGSDLAEPFDIRHSEPEADLMPGMVVCLDPENPGGLVVSTKSYDRKVAGIISGAGGIRTGMLMGQKGTAADGESPVALTGRVYCLADASNGPIETGDLLTTSDIPGHAMKVTDFEKADGSMIGKAITPLESGRGLVLVLVTLQ